MKGRKSKQDSRAAELCRALTAWKQTPDSLRPSLRALARQLGTSHELLRHYLAGLEKRKHKEVSRIAEAEAAAIRSHAKAENRTLTSWELQQVQALDTRSFRALLACAAIDCLERIKKSAKRGPLHRLEVKTLEILVKKGVPGA